MKLLKLLKDWKREKKLLSVVRKLSNIKEWDREKLSEIIYNIEIDKENNTKY